MSAMLSKDEIVVWTRLVSRGIASSLDGLSRMIDQDLNVTSLNVKQYPVKDAPALLGGVENIVVGIYLTISGDASGHLMLAHDPKMAFQLADVQMGLPPGSTRSLDDMERSIMGEMGNITGSFFLNAIADITNLTLMPSPPAVMLDMAGAILGIALSDIQQNNDDVMVAKATFSADNQNIGGTFLIMPTSDFLYTILKRSIVYQK